MRIRRRRRNRTVLQSDRRRMWPNPPWCREPHFLCLWSLGVGVAMLESCSWRRPMEKGLQPMLSAPLCHPEFPWPSLYLCLLGVFMSICLLSFIEWEKMFGGRFLPLNAGNPQWWSKLGVSPNPGRAVLTLQHAGAALQLLKENWEAQKSKRVHKHLWNKLQSVNSQRPKAAVEVANTAKADLA